ncbi:MAG: DUF4325 domain-containing protein [Candidatus Harrisonbacteria bacterium CG10_big_fil_rev_8_21_14_0_10_49_15]|uniref:DUF4325 domain-containing protein n=1 Tax=Candidatus Harrisonbacteria bacterium CG10_big_fil_rev_8_21_14_0_10_49_15 TaxID=1974587 RepID=A0A2H0UL75_9BACT|nr:MAG: DUF4325 domain-containing protein [Candidatus Harrisonbacteria bacterium CG10_big_fil_rev_8_21_14_0_10_49_15]
MRIEIKKFGDTLVSRDAGREALNAFRPTLASLLPAEKIQMDFSGIFTISPSWAAEFILPIQKEYGEAVELLPTDNPAVKATLDFLESLNQKD